MISKLSELQSNDRLLILACDEGDNIAQIEELQSKQELLVEEASPYQIKAREKIAKENGFAYVKQLSGGTMMGEKTEGGTIESWLLFRSDGEEKKMGPFDSIDDSGSGTYLVYENINTGGQSSGTYKLLDREGKVVRNFGGTEAVHFKGYFKYSEGDPIRMFYKDGTVGGQVTRTAFLRPDGGVLFSLPGAHSATYSEGYVWMDEGIGVKVLYDRDGNELRRENLFDQVYPFENGWAVATRWTNNYRQVYKIPVSGMPVDLKIKIDLTKKDIRRYGDICFSHDLNGKPFYFTLDGDILPLPATGDAREEIYAKEGLFKGVVADGVRIYDLDGRDHYGKVFERFESVNEGLAAAREPDGKWYYIDLERNKIIPETKSEISLFFYFKHGLASVKDEEGWFLIDRTGKDICHGRRYQDYFEYDGQGIFVSSDNKTYLDEWGEEVFGEKS